MDAAGNAGGGLAVWFFPIVSAGRSDRRCAGGAGRSVAGAAAGCVGCVHQSAGRVRAAALPERGGYVGLGFFPTSPCNARGRVCTGPLLARAAFV